MLVPLAEAGLALPAHQEKEVDHDDEGARMGASSYGSASGKAPQQASLFLLCADFSEQMEGEKLLLSS